MNSAGRLFTQAKVGVGEIMSSLHVAQPHNTVNSAGWLFSGTKVGVGEIMSSLHVVTLIAAVARFVVSV